MSKRVLLTGAAGFIGHHAVEHFLKNTDWQIVVLDSLSYAGDVTRLLDIQNFDRSRIRIFWHDLRAAIPYTLIRDIGNIDYIINYASESHVDKSIENPIGFIYNNVMLILNILEYAKIIKPTKLVHISTDEVFGPAPEGYAFKEWDTHLPSNPYSASKSAQEAIAIAYWRTYGIPLLICTGMNIFGEHQHKEKFIPKTIKALLKNESVCIHGKQEKGQWLASKRMWLHASNHADAILFILNNCDPLPFPAHSKPFKINIAGEIELDNLEVYNKIVDIMGIKEKASFYWCDYHSARPGHDYRYALDGNLLKSLGWKPPLTLEESFAKTVTWMVEHADRWL